MAKDKVGWDMRTRGESREHFTCDGNALVGAFSSRGPVYSSISFHDENNFSVERATELVRERFGEVITQAEVANERDDCHQCSRVCPLNRNYSRPGKLFTSKMWYMYPLSNDVTYVPENILR